MRVTIHQPDFMPWLGFFKKISKVDHWIVLDHTIGNPRDAAFWGRRVKILINGEGKWLSLPLVKPPNGVIGIPIRDMAFSDLNPKVWVNGLRTIQMAYASAPFFDRYFSVVEDFFKDPELNLMSRNLRFIKAVMSILEITPSISFSSDYGVESASTQLLVDLLGKCGAHTYVCGDGASGYQDDELFDRNGIRLEYNNFCHPEYRQLRTAEFVPGLSIIDALFMVGDEKIAKWMAAE
jgi:hypothetical protein